MSSRSFPAPHVGFLAPYSVRSRRVGRSGGAYTVKEASELGLRTMCGLQCRWVACLAHRLVLERRRRATVSVHVKPTTTACCQLEGKVRTLPSELLTASLRPLREQKASLAAAVKPTQRRAYASQQYLLDSCVISRVSRPRTHHPQSTSVPKGDVEAA